MLDKPMSMLPRFKEVMNKLNISIEDLSKITGKSPNTIRCWYNCTVDIPIKWLIVIASKYNISFDYIFGITDEFCKYSEIKINKKDFGKNLVKVRKANDKSAKEIIISLNISQSGYSHYEKGIYFIKTKYLYNISLLYENFSIDEDLLERKKNLNNRKSKYIGS